MQHLCRWHAVGSRGEFKFQQENSLELVSALRVLLLVLCKLTVFLHLVKFWHQQYMLTVLTKVAVTRSIEVLSTPTPVIMRNSALISDAYELYNCQ